MLLVAGAVLLAGTAGLLGCRNRESEESTLLIEHARGIDVFSPPAVRRPRIDALKNLPVHSEALVAVRDLCASAHEALLAVEEEQSRAAARLEAISQGDARARLTAEERAELEAAVGRAITGLESAQEQLDRCQTEVDSLALAKTAR